MKGDNSTPQIHSGLHFYRVGTSLPPTNQVPTLRLQRRCHHRGPATASLLTCQGAPKGGSLITDTTKPHFDPACWSNSWLDLQLPCKICQKKGDNDFISVDTVDGRNPSLPGMYKTLSTNWCGISSINSKLQVIYPLVLPNKMTLLLHLGLHCCHLLGSIQANGTSS